MLSSKAETNSLSISANPLCKSVFQKAEEMPSIDRSPESQIFGGQT